MNWYRKECLIWRVMFLLLMVAVVSFAYTGKIWTNESDANITCASNPNITCDSNGNWALRNLSSAYSGDHDGTLTNFSGTYWVTGKYSNALSFDGNNDYVTISDNSIFSSSNFSVRLVVRFDAFQADNNLIMGKANEFWIGYDITFAGCGTANRIHFALRNSGGTWACVSSTTNPSADGTTWYRVFATYDGTSMRLYINGTQEGGSVSQTQRSNDIHPLDIGSYSADPTTYSTDATIDDVAYYDSVVSDPGDSAIGNSSGGLVSVWHFDESSGTTANDSQVAGTSYNSSSPEVETTCLDLGYPATFDMSGFRATEVQTTGSVKYQYATHATSCASATYNGTWLTRAQIQAISDITGNEVIRFKAQLNSNGTTFARVDHFTIPYSPYNTVSADVRDAYLSNANQANNYGASTGPVRVGYDSGATDWGNLILKLDTHLIPREVITQVELCLYVEYISGKWEGSYALRGYRLKEGNYWREGTKTGAAAGANEPSWDRRGGGTGASTPGSNAAWLGSEGADTDGTDFYSWATGDWEITLGASFTSQYYCDVVTISWLRSWRDDGRNRGIIFRTPERTNTHVANVYLSEHGTNPPYFKITYALDQSDIGEPRVISDTAHGYAAFWPGQFHMVRDTQDSPIAIVYNEDKTLSYYKYDHHVWAHLYTTSVAKTRIGTVLLDSGKFIHHLTGDDTGPEGYCHTMQELISTYPDDSSVYNSPIAVTSNTWFSLYGSADIDSSDKIHAIAPRAGCNANYSVEYWTKASGGSWTLINSNLVDSAEMSYLSDQRPLYFTTWMESGNLYAIYSRADNNSSRRWRDSVSFLQSDDGGTTWKNSAGSTMTTPVQFWEDSRLAPAPTQIETDTLGSTVIKVNNTILVLYFVRHPGGTLGSSHVSNFTATNNDFAFGGGTATKMVGQTYTASSTSIGRLCVKLKKVGNPIDKLYASLHTSDDGTNGYERTASNSPILPADVTTSFQSFCQDWHQYTGNARVVVSSLPRIPYTSNGGFDTDTTGWITTGPSAFVNSGATLTRITSGCYDGAGCGEIVTGSSTYTGAAASLTGTFYKGTTYTAKARFKSATSTATVSFVFGNGTSGDNCNVSQALTTSWQEVSCNWTPTANTSGGYVVARYPTGGTSITFQVDFFTPSPLNDYYVISTDNANSYSGGNFRSFTTSWSEDTTKDLNFELYQRTDSPGFRSRVRKLVSGVWSDAGQTNPNGTFGILVKNIANTLFKVTTAEPGDDHYEPSQVEWDIWHSSSADEGQTWAAMQNLTQDATASRKYIYPSRSRSIAASVADFMWQSGSANFGSDDEVTDLYFSTIELTAKSSDKWNKPFNYPFNYPLMREDRDQETVDGIKSINW